MRPDPYREEEERIRRLRALVDTAARSLRDEPLSEAEAWDLIYCIRRRVLALFPDKGTVFDLIYIPRFRRLLERNAGVRVDRALRRAAPRPER